MKIKDLELSDQIKNKIQASFDHVNSCIADGELMPKVLLSNSQKDGKNLIIAAAFTSEKEKDLFSKVIKIKATEIGADLSIFTSESWTLEGKDAEEYQNNRGKYQHSMSNHPKRKEAVAFVVETLSKSYMGTATILTKGKKRYIEEIEFLGGDVQGRFTGFLPRP